MDVFQAVLDLFLHLDRHLVEWAAYFGPWLYVVLIAIIFAETGLVIAPFLPGDSLLFAVGALCALDNSPVRLDVMMLFLILAGIAGDAVNYWIGRVVGPRVFTKEKSWLLNKKHLERTRDFYERHGGKTIILARFIPIVRTFAPFVAGIGRMEYRRFAVYNITGAVVWVSSFMFLGFWFGSYPIVKRNFSLVILGIIFVSVLPIVIEVLLAWRRGPAAEAVPATESTPAAPPQAPAATAVQQESAA
ncbi:MAG TPA: DedA family protein [Gemmatales bacterium]|nr:DedA family protein [Gemmatales bacterium]